MRCERAAAVRCVSGSGGLDDLAGPCCCVTDNFAHSEGVLCSARVMQATPCFFW